MMNSLEQTILNYLQSRPSNWKWVYGSIYSKERTVELFKKDKGFREMVIKEVHQLAVDLFLRGEEQR